MISIRKPESEKSAVCSAFTILTGMMLRHRFITGSVLCSTEDRNPAVSLYPIQKETGETSHIIRILDLSARYLSRIRCHLSMEILESDMSGIQQREALQERMHSLLF